MFSDPLQERLEECKLAGRIIFDDSALKQLERVSGGNWDIAEIYAGVAVLDTLQNQEGNRNTISAKGIKEVDPIEVTQLILGNKDVWRDVKHIGTQAPAMEPEGVKLRRALTSWDADKDRDSRSAIRESRLPQYAIVEGIQYREGDDRRGPEVRIPFKYDPSKAEIRAVAQSLAEFVSEYTEQPQEVEDVSRDGFGKSSIGVQFDVKEKNPEKDRFLVDRNYRVAHLSFMEGARGEGAVSITRQMLCGHDKKTLEAYVQSLEAQEE